MELRFQPRRGAVADPSAHTAPAERQTRQRADLPGPAEGSILFAALVAVSYSGPDFTD